MKVNFTPELENLLGRVEDDGFLATMNFYGVDEAQSILEDAGLFNNERQKQSFRNAIDTMNKWGNTCSELSEFLERRATADAMDELGNCD